MQNELKTDNKNWLADIWALSPAGMRRKLEERIKDIERAETEAEVKEKRDTGRRERRKCKYSVDAVKLKKETVLRISMIHLLHTKVHVITECMYKYSLQKH